MRLTFDGFELDLGKRELRQNGVPVAIEPKVFELLVFLISNRERVVSKEELNEAAWGGRIVSDAAIDTCIKAARRAIGDDGKTQQKIRTLPRRGFRFVAVVEERRQPALAVPPRRASIAIMPFVESGAATGLGGALAHDVITRIAKLRSLFVIAQGSVFALHERGMSSEDSGCLLGVDYTVSGEVMRRGNRVIVRVEMSETRTARIVWAETFDAQARDVLAVLDGIGNQIVSSVVSEIEALERNRAILKVPNSLDAWEAYHRGLWHMYRFTKSDNEQARTFFEYAIELDRTFSRALAGLSFTHWQDAFQDWQPDCGKALDLAYAKASDSLLIDGRDPAAHWAMGRALWLHDRHDEAVGELEQAVDLSPNFSLAHYNLAFVHATTGDPTAAIAHAEHARALSPFDPMMFGMLGAPAMALVRIGRFEEAAELGIKAAARPNSHPHIRSIAAFSLALAGRMEEARIHLAALRVDVPGYKFADFLRAYRFDANGVKLFRKGARKLGIE